MDGSTLLKRFKTSTSSDECWVQGSTFFADNITQQLVETKGQGIVHLILSDASKHGRILSPMLQSKFSLTALSHAQVGGVLKGSWRIGTSIPWPDWKHLHRKSNVTPRVHDIIGSTLSGTPAGKSMGPADMISHLDTLPSTSIATLKVLAPSVFSPWCTRHLGEGEIMHSFDLDFAVRKQMKGHYPTATLPFLSQPPAKVIFRAMESVRAAPAVLTWKRSLEDISPDTHRPSKLARAVSSAIESTFGATPSNNPSPQPTPTTAPTSSKSVSPTMGMAGPHGEVASVQAKAARSDDAPVDEDEWDFSRQVI